MWQGDEFLKHIYETVASIRFLSAGVRSVKSINHQISDYEKVNQPFTRYPFSDFFLQKIFSQYRYSSGKPKQSNECNGLC